jgi:SHAQKYF class myb-like DNA-binding protein
MKSSIETDSIAPCGSPNAATEEDKSLTLSPTKDTKLQLNDSKEISGILVNTKITEDTIVKKVGPKRKCLDETEAIIEQDEIISAEEEEFQKSADESSPESKDQDQKRSQKKRLIWTDSLHNSFVKAIEKLGMNAVPKKILKEMNVEGITRENIASHLQVERGIWFVLVIFFIAL